MSCKTASENPAHPFTYGANLLHRALHGGHTLPIMVDLAVLAAFCIGLFMALSVQHPETVSGT